MCHTDDYKITYTSTSPVVKKNLNLILRKLYQPFLPRDFSMENKICIHSILKGEYFFDFFFFFAIKILPRTEISITLKDLDKLLVDNDCRVDHVISDDNIHKAMGLSSNIY